MLVALRKKDQSFTVPNIVEALVYVLHIYARFSLLKSHFSFGTAANVVQVVHSSQQCCRFILNSSGEGIFSPPVSI